MPKVPLIEQNCRIREALPIAQELVSNYHQRRVPAHWRHVATQPDTEVVVESEDLQAVGYMGSIVSGILESPEFRRLFTAHLRKLHRLCAVVDKVESTRRLPPEPIALSAMLERGGKLVPPPEWRPPADYQWYREPTASPQGTGRAKTERDYISEGMAAYDAGEPRTECPYPRAHDGHAHWLRGWRAASVLDASLEPEPEGKPNGTPKATASKRKRGSSAAAKRRKAQKTKAHVQAGKANTPTAAKSGTEPT